jgi:putative transposase
LAACAKLEGVPRGARVVAVGAPHHVTQRGNNRQKIFVHDSDRRLYMALLAEQARRNQLRILGYCLMPNHVHLIALPERSDSLAQALGRAHNLYSRWFNARHHRSGHLWQNRFYSTPLDRRHLSTALRYVDLNPLRARLVERAVEYRWSSARAHALGQDASGLLDMKLWAEICPLNDWAPVLEAATPEQELLQRIRDATRSGKPLGEQRFVSELEGRFGQQLQLRPRGRPRRQHDSAAVA